MRKIEYKDVLKDYKHFKQGIRKGTFFLMKNGNTISIILSKKKKRITYGFEYYDYEYYDYESLEISSKTESICTRTHNVNKEEKYRIYDFYNLSDFYNKRGKK